MDEVKGDQGCRLHVCYYISLCIQRIEMTIMSTQYYPSCPPTPDILVSNSHPSVACEVVAFLPRHTNSTLSDRWVATQYRGGFGLALLLSSRIQVDYPDRAYSTFISSCSSSLRCRIS
jgi:hypothetical protein